MFIFWRKLDDILLNMPVIYELQDQEDKTSLVLDRTPTLKQGVEFWLILENATERLLTWNRLILASHIFIEYNFTF